MKCYNIYCDNHEKYNAIYHPYNCRTKPLALVKKCLARKRYNRVDRAKHLKNMAWKVERNKYHGRDK